MNLDDFKKELCKEAHGRTPDGEHCVECGEPFSNKNCYSKAGWAERLISGLCELCFDRICKEPDEEEWPDEDAPAF